MAFIREKEISGNRYLYLVKNVRVGGKTRQKVLKYLGPVGKVSKGEIRKAKEEAKGRGLSTKEKIKERERACFNYLKKISKSENYVLVGGYAVNAYEFSRFSVDLDLVVPSESVEVFEKFAKKQGFKLSQERADIDEIYSGKFKRFGKKKKLSVSVDLLINSLKSRQTETSYSFSYLYKNSKVLEVFGRSLSTEATVRVPDREMLIALKMNSMRKADQRDIIALCYKKPDIGKISKHLSRCPKEKIKDQISRLRSFIESPKSKDSVKGVFSVSSDRIHEKAVENCKEILEGVEKNLSQ